MPLIIKNNNTKQVKVISGLSLLSLIFAFLSVFINFCCFITGGIPLGIAFGIFSIAFTIISKDKANISKLAIALSSIGILISLLMFAYLLYVLKIINDPNAATYYYNYINSIFPKK